MRDRLLKVLLLIVVLGAAASAGFSQDTWISVRSENFHLIGNAKEKDIRNVAAKLEQFRETFRLLFPKARFTQSIDTNVIVFKDDKSYKPFKPRGEDGKPDEWIAGYFQPGEDANYITLSTDGPDEATFGTIFHEYVHFLVNTQFGKSRVPPWFNEGLAEFYQTFHIENDQKVFLGRLQNDHLRLLQRAKLIPFKQFFAVDNYSLHRNGNHSRSIFYAQSWALLHYLIQGGRQMEMNRFLALVLDDVEPEKAFREAFGSGYEEMEKELQDYVKQRKFQVRWVEFDKKLDFSSDVTVTPLRQADANAYLGDLLYHTHEYDDAAGYLRDALEADPDHTLANTAYGLVLMKKRQFEEAKRHLQKAVATNDRNHLAQYSYAYALSRESMDELGYVSKFPKDSAEKMRIALKSAIDANPNFTPSYELLAFINLVNDEDLDGALEYLQKGLAVQPGKQEYSLLAAKIYLRQEKYVEAEGIANLIKDTATEDNLRRDAERIITTIEQYKESMARIREAAAKSTGSRGEPIFKRRSEVTQEEIALLNREMLINRMNMELPSLSEGEAQVEGRLENLRCIDGKPNYSVRTSDGLLELYSEDFTSLFLLTLDSELGPLEVGCDADLSAVPAVFTYKVSEGEGPFDGSLIALTFVPEFFRIKTAEEIESTRPVIIIDEDRKPAEGRDFDERRQVSMLESLRKALRKPLDGEQRVMGVLKGVECRRKDSVYSFSTDDGELALRNDPDTTLQIITFTPDTAGIRFKCGMDPPPTRAVITYVPGSENKTAGRLIAIEFVPSIFELE